jgi:hypothetical protein
MNSKHQDTSVPKGTCLECTLNSTSNDIQSFCVRGGETKYPWRKSNPGCPVLNHSPFTTFPNAGRSTTARGSHSRKAAPLRTVHYSCHRTLHAYADVDTNKIAFKTKLNSQTACYHSAQNLLSTPLLSKILTIIIYKTAILPVVLCRCTTWSFILSEEYQFRVFENRVVRMRMRKVFGPKGAK